MTEEEKKIAKGPPMTKIGAAKLMAEPHMFEVTLMAVKDPAPVPKQGQLPPGLPFLQYPAHGQTASPSPSNYRPPPPSYQNPAPPTRTLPHPHPVASPAPQVHQTPTPRPPPPHQPANRPAGPSPAGHRPPATPATGSSAPAPDPVIHALAQRASTDLELKSVMKIVATGKATQSQLEYFQRHIDELTKMVKLQQEAEAKKAQLVAPVAAPQAPRTVPAPQARPMQTSTPVRTPAPAAYQTNMPSGGTPVRPHHQQYQQPMTVSAQRPRAAPAIAPLHVLIQFGENANERFLFPKHSILEYLPGLTTVLCSFMVTRRGSEAADPSHYDSKLEYWEPITIRLTSDVQTLSTLGRYVATAAEARAHMQGVMDRCECVDDMHLALRLPREKGGGEEILALASV
jgi:hypothetical protein